MNQSTEIDMADFSFVNHGSVVTVIAESETAQEFARLNFEVARWQGTPEHFTTDWRAGRDLSERLVSDGFEVT
jgi:hypothetical protein